MNLTKDQMEKLKDLNSDTSVSSFGEIVTHDVEKGYSEKNKNAEKTKIKQETNFQALADNRKRINRTTSYPYNAIAQLEI
ncbi:hypothetical protein ACFOUO_11295 [Salinithrix halophila]|uniref:Uncharacterized protein n=1 Tax=Salinithrix halophila TaxID=1485204 RepID=A0ABV8JG87_9BACL